jgi:NADPH:quinone reductase-like Zn-dependent oxidoreductase
MKAFLLDRYGKTGKTRIGEVPLPRVGEGDVLIRVHAASVNPVDFKIRDGDLKQVLPFRLPLILGNDLAGVVTQVGAKVTRFRPGDEVYTRPDKSRIGAFAEFIAVREVDVARKPANTSMVEAASLPLVGLTAWQALVERANVQPGQTVLIHAGSGGVGAFAIQLAKHLGATVATTTSTANVGMVEQLGADIVVDYKTQDFADVLRDVDMVLDTLGPATVEKSFKVMKPGGKLISISGPPDAAFAREFGLAWPLVQVMRLLSWRIRRQARQHGVDYAFLFMHPDGEQLQQITALVEAGTIRPVIDKVFPFESIHDALAHVETGRAKGKVVVTLV